MKKFAVVVSILFLTWQAKAQFNYNEMSKKTIYFGIAMGLNVADFKIINAPLTPGNDSVKYIRTKIGPGFNLGIIGNYQFHKYFDLRFIPTLSFSDKNIVYTGVNNTQITKDFHPFISISPYSFVSNQTLLRISGCMALQVYATIMTLPVTLKPAAPMTL
jgi:hypothetical protein